LDNTCTYTQQKIIKYKGRRLQIQCYEIVFIVVLLLILTL